MTVASDFLLELHDLMKKFQLEFYYTNDDGVHIAIDGEVIYTGGLDSDDLAGLRDSIKQHGGNFINKGKEKQANKVIEKSGLC
jgi:hypothetical protein